MGRWFVAVVAAGAFSLLGQDSKPQNPPAQEQKQLKRERPQPVRNNATEAPPEEDESVAPQKFSFNPLQSEKDVRVGDYYFKQHNYRAALGRYRDATQWNDGNSNAWLRLGEAAEKTKDTDVAKQAYAKYLALEPDAKNAAEIKKRLSKLK